MKVISVAALPLVGLMALPGTPILHPAQPLRIAAAPALVQQSDRLVATQSVLGMTIEPYQEAPMSITLPTRLDAALANG
jgi:hypothetical protein